jgi:hypothetical protein
MTSAREISDTSLEMSKKISILCLGIVSTIVLCCLRHCSMVDRLSVGRKLIHTVNGNVASKYVATYVIKGKLLSRIKKTNIATIAITKINIYDYI